MSPLSSMGERVESPLSCNAHNAFSRLTVKQGAVRSKVFDNADIIRDGDVPPTRKPSVSYGLRFVLTTRQQLHDRTRVGAPDISQLTYRNNNLRG